ncbi:MAG: HU family DNA-binding protein [Bacteroidaceae bacterium]|nr:HU family DNA-binding protein [Bacteroidaceae bacterium]
MPTISCLLRKASGALQDKDAIYVEPLNYSTIKAKSLLTHLQKRLQLDSGQVQAVISGLVKQMIVFLQIGHKVEVPGLGIFSLKMKGDVIRDSEGVLQIDNARYGGIHFSPCKTFRENLWDTKFSLFSHNVLMSYTLNEDLILEIARELCEENGFFLAKEFAARAVVSYSYTCKKLNELVAAGKVLRRCSGRLKIYTMPK